LKLKQLNPLHRGTAIAGKNPATRDADGEGRRWEMQEGNKPHQFEALGGEGIVTSSLEKVIGCIPYVRQDQVPYTVDITSEYPKQCINKIEYNCTLLHDSQS
jgi:hypothetical protein